MENMKARVSFNELYCKLFNSAFASAQPFYSYHLKAGDIKSVHWTALYIYPHSSLICIMKCINYNCKLQFKGRICIAFSKTKLKKIMTQSETHLY